MSILQSPALKGREQRGASPDSVDHSRAYTNTSDTDACSTRASSSLSLSVSDSVSRLWLEQRHNLPVRRLACHGVTSELTFELTSGQRDEYETLLPNVAHPRTRLLSPYQSCNMASSKSLIGVLSPHPW